MKNACYQLPYFKSNSFSVNSVHICSGVLRLLCTRVHKLCLCFYKHLFNMFQVGQMQLLRRIIAHELATSSKFDSKLLASALSNVNGYETALTKMIGKTCYYLNTIVPPLPINLCVSCVCVFVYKPMLTPFFTFAV